MINFSLKINNEILNAISQIDEFKGEWKAIRQMEPEVLTYLKKVATIESIGSSNRIEGNKLSDKDVEKLLSNIKIKSFKNRDEEEVAGYADVSNLIFDDYEIIPFTENYIKQLHSMLLKYSKKDERHRGEYKTLPNSVSAFDENGKEIGVIFETATPFDTPHLMEELLKWTNENIKNKTYHPLIIISVFVVNFLAVHPFQDGNGRLSRALTNLLLLKFGYQYVSYSSLESIIEDNKSAYYMVLRKTQGTLKKKEPDYEPWIDFFMKTLQKQTVRLRYKIEHLPKLESKNNKNVVIDFDDLPDTAVKIYKLFDKIDRIDIKYIKDKIDAGDGKIKGALLLLQKKKLIKKHGVTNGCWYSKEIK